MQSQNMTQFLPYLDAWLNRNCPLQGVTKKPDPKGGNPRKLERSSRRV